MKDKTGNRIALAGYILFAIFFVGAMLICGGSRTAKKTDIDQKDLYAPKIMQPINK